MVNRNVVLALALTAVAMLALLAHLQDKGAKERQALVLEDADTIKQIAVFAPEVSKNHQARQTSVTDSEQNTPDWVLTRNGEVWSIEVTAKRLRDAQSQQSNATAAIQADKNRVAPLLALLQLPDRKAYAVTEVDLQELGLQPPQAVVTLDQLNFIFGHLSVDGSARYVQVNDQVYLYQEFAFPLISAGANAFIQQDSDAAHLK